MFGSEFRVPGFGFRVPGSRSADSMGKREPERPRTLNPEPKLNTNGEARTRKLEHTVRCSFRSQRNQRIYLGRATRGTVRCCQRDQGEGHSSHGIGKRVERRHTKEQTFEIPRQQGGAGNARCSSRASVAGSMRQSAKTTARRRSSPFRPATSCFATCSASLKARRRPCGIRNCWRLSRSASAWWSAARAYSRCRNCRREAKPSL